MDNGKIHAGLGGPHPKGGSLDGEKGKGRLAACSAFCLPYHELFLLRDAPLLVHTALEPAEYRLKLLECELKKPVLL